MRKARDASWIKNGKDEICGINLGADFVAEHEWGIKRLKSRFNMLAEDDVRLEDKFGIERRRLNKPTEDCVILFEAGDTLVLMVDSSYGLKEAAEYIKDEHKNKSSLRESWYAMGKEDTLVTAWSEDDLGIRVRGEENKENLRKLYEAMMNGEAAIWLGGGGLFGNAGLCLAIIDKVDKNQKKVMAQADLLAFNLKQAAEETGIKQKIDEANENWRKCQEVETGSRYYGAAPYSYYALSPSWKKGFTKTKTKYPVIFWLNPQNQQEVNYGWFTVEELEQWLDNKGPIPMTTAQKKKKSVY